MIRLARARKTIGDFDLAKLSEKGYRVLVDEGDKKLPNGEIIARGVDFRNLAHLRNFQAGNEGRSAEVMVPCGGRPEAINISNVDQLIDDTGKPRVAYIIEGANLFITQEARLQLENAGCIVFKDGEYP